MPCNVSIILQQKKLDVMQNVKVIALLINVVEQIVRNLFKNVVK